MMISNLKIIHAVALVSCLLPMPYGYFMVVRLFSTALFGYYAYQEFQNDNQTTGFVYIGLALLFQPIYKIVLGRALWNLVDIVVGGWLGFQWYENKKTE